MLLCGQSSVLALVLGRLHALDKQGHDDYGQVIGNMQQARQHNITAGQHIDQAKSQAGGGETYGVNPLGCHQRIYVEHAKQHARHRQRHPGGGVLPEGTNEELAEKQLLHYRRHNPDLYSGHKSKSDVLVVVFVVWVLVLGWLGCFT